MQSSAHRGCKTVIYSSAERLTAKQFFASVDMVMILELDNAIIVHYQFASGGHVFNIRFAKKSGKVSNVLCNSPIWFIYICTICDNIPSDFFIKITI